MLTKGEHLSSDLLHQLQALVGDRYIDGLIDRHTDGWMDGWMDGWLDR